ncbi:MAG: hypothetical protein GXO66_09395 [Euryarchaeota archaeon]|nr:hypothetical protein [Euryarchaeota archaeon]
MGQEDFERFEEYKKWVATIKETTKPDYKHSMKLYIEFTGINPKQLIDEAE